MKKSLLTSALSITCTLFYFNSFAQGSLSNDQNPSFAISRDKYMKLADSINQWHRTTFQETYKAFDWYENKMERRNENRRFRQELYFRNRYYSSGRYYGPYDYNQSYQRYYRPRYRFQFCWF